MKRMTFIALLAIALGLTAANPAAAQDWPQRPVTIVVPFAAGGGTDAIARSIANRMSNTIGQRVLVDNRAGAGGAIGAAYVASAAPDGYTLLMATSSTHTILPLTQANLAYDPKRDLMPVGMVVTIPNILIVSPKLPVNSVADLVKYAKENPGKLNFSSSGNGSITHLIGELFKYRAGIDVQHVPFRTGVQALPELIQNQINFMFDNVVWPLPYVRSGELKGLALATSTRSSLAPEIPTVAETFPGFLGITWVGVAAPARSPASAIQKLRAELAASLTDREFTGRLAAIGAEAVPSASAEFFDKMVADETAQWAELIQKAGIKLQ